MGDHWSGTIWARVNAIAIGVAAFLVVWWVSEIIGRIAEATARS